jgi:hypothetical protein
MHHIGVPATEKLERDHPIAPLLPLITLFLPALRAQHLRHAACDTRTQEV